MKLTRVQEVRVDGIVSHYAVFLFNPRTNKRDSTPIATFLKKTEAEEMSERLNATLSNH
jgi:hypothetical protein